MASFFGEVRPLLSRAIDDEDADNQPKYTVHLVNTEKRDQFNENVKLVIFSVGEIASVFLKSYFLRDNSNLISTVKYTCEKDDLDSTFYTSMKSNVNVKDVVAASVFTSSSGILICEISNSIPEYICHEVTDLIFKNFFPSQVLILTSQHMATFKRESSISIEMPFLKRLCTSVYLSNYSCNIPRLDSPNFLSNMPASLLLKSEVTKVPALCVVNYVDTDSIDSLSVHVFDDVLKEPLISNIPVNQDAESKVIRYVKSKQSIESNLYI